MPLDWLGEETVGGLWVAEMDALDFPMPQHTHTHVYTLVHTHLACVLCLYELQNMHKSCAENLYLHFVLPVLFNNIWSANGCEGGRGRGKWQEESGREEKEQSGSWNFEVSLPHAASVGVAVAVTVCAASKVLHFPTLHLFQCSKGSWSGVSCSCKLFVLFQVPNNLTTKILNFCLNCRQCVLQPCVCGCMCQSGCVSSH